MSRLELAQEFMEEVPDIGRCAEAPELCKDSYGDDAPAGRSQRRKLTVCGDHEHETKAPTETTDRECAPNQCTCENGRAVGSDNCESHEEEQCSACDPGYTLSDQQCVKNECVCDNGTVAPSELCTTNGAQQCASCDANHFLQTADDGSRRCKEMTTCPDFEYISRPGTATSDRQCKRLSFKSQHPSHKHTCFSYDDKYVKGRIFDEELQQYTADGTCTARTKCTKDQLTEDPTSREITSRIKRFPGDSDVYAASMRDRVCKDLTVCKPDEYISKAETRNYHKEVMTDRECNKISPPCSEQEFQTQAEIPGKRNRTCRKLKVCGKNEYEAKAPTWNSDRVCRQFRPPCGPSEFESKAPTATSDRHCQPLTVCGTHQYQSKAPTATSDRRCKNLTVCGANQYQTRAPTDTRDRACAPIRMCANNEYESKAPTSQQVSAMEKMGRTYWGQGYKYYRYEKTRSECFEMCEQDDVCTGATFNVRKKACWLQKGKGEEKGGEPDDIAYTKANIFTSQRECRKIDPPCNSSQFQTQDEIPHKRNRKCQDLTMCGPNEYQHVKNTWNSDRVCRPLTPACQKWKQFESRSIQRDASGMALNNRECKNVRTCAANEYRSKQQTATSDLECSPIPSDHHRKWGNKPNQMAIDIEKGKTYGMHAWEVEDLGTTTHFLDRFEHLDCPQTDAINGFRLRRVDGNKFKYDVNCTSLPSQTPIEVKMTGADNWHYRSRTGRRYNGHDDGGGNIIFLDRHNVDCGNEALLKFQLRRNGPPNYADLIYYEYHCTKGLAPMFNNCKTHNTPFQHDGAGNVQFLDRQAPFCGNQQVMTQFKLQRDHGNGNQVRYQFRCCDRKLGMGAM